MTTIKDLEPIAALEMFLVNMGLCYFKRKKNKLSIKKLSE
jgi:hypothetical protein